MNTNYEQEIEDIQLKIAKITNMILDGCKDPILRDDLNHYREELQNLIHPKQEESSAINFY